MRARDWLRKGEGLTLRARGTGYVRTKDRLHEREGLAVGGPEIGKREGLVARG